MNNDIRQTRQPAQTARFVKIGKHDCRTGLSPCSTGQRVAQHSVDAVMRLQLGKNAAGDVPAADKKYFLHVGIVADGEGEPMRYQVTVQPRGRQVEAEADETLLDAALRQGLTMPYGCKDGACGACKGKVLSGTIDPGKGQALSEDEKTAGLALYCCARATSDLSIECKQLRSAHDIPVTTLPGRIEKL